jgi:hypothetical protein
MRRIRTVPALAVLVLVVIAAVVPGHPARAQGRQMPPPPEEPVRLYRPDGSTCRPENLTAAYQGQLLQFADQPRHVLLRLREVQLEMAEKSLKACAEQNLLSRPEAERIWRELQLLPLPQASQRP